MSKAGNELQAAADRKQVEKAYDYPTTLSQTQPIEKKTFNFNTTQEVSQAAKQSDYNTGTTSSKIPDNLGSRVSSKLQYEV